MRLQQRRAMNRMRPSMWPPLCWRQRPAETNVRRFRCPKTRIGKILFSVTIWATVGRGLPRRSGIPRG